LQACSFPILVGAGRRTHLPKAAGAGHPALVFFLFIVNSKLSMSPGGVK
jgi:hypothetical protein